MMMKVSTTNDNGSNAFAQNLLAPISFYPKAEDGSSGLDDEKPSECHHEVHYDPENVVTCVQIYLTPFDTGFVEQWHKF